MLLEVRVVATLGRQVMMGWGAAVGFWGPAVSCLSMWVLVTCVCSFYENSLTCALVCTFLYICFTSIKSLFKTLKKRKPIALLSLKLLMRMEVLLYC